MSTVPWNNVKGYIYRVNLLCSFGVLLFLHWDQILPITGLPVFGLVLGIILLCFLLDVERLQWFYHYATCTACVLLFWTFTSPYFLSSEFFGKVQSSFIELDQHILCTVWIVTIILIIAECIVGVYQTVTNNVNLRPYYFVCIVVLSLDTMLRIIIGDEIMDKWSSNIIWNLIQHLMYHAVYGFLTVSAFNIEIKSVPFLLIIFVYVLVCKIVTSISLYIVVAIVVCILGAFYQFGLIGEAIQDLQEIKESLFNIRNDQIRVQEVKRVLFTLSAFVALVFIFNINLSHVIYIIIVFSVIYLLDHVIIRIRV